MLHSAGTCGSIRELCAAGGGAIDPDTYAVEASLEAALRAAGGACAMIRALLGGEDRVGFCGTRPGRAPRRTASGRWASASSTTSRSPPSWRSASWALERVLVLDWDVHHGNGTAEIFRRRADVLVANIHQAGIFPGTGPLTDVGSGPGEGFTINLPVPAGLGRGTLAFAARARGRAGRRPVRARS